MSRIIDISLPIKSGMPVYPGTEETKITTAKNASGAAVLSVIGMGSHAGTHVDAPNHFIDGGAGVEGYALDRFYGPCRVLDLSEAGERISRKDLEQYDITSDERILLRTNNSIRGFENFYDDYVYLSSEAADYLGELSVSLVGIDSLSIKQKGSPDNTAHMVLLSKGIPILEGLDLSRANGGEYTLSAFPLNFQGIDGSPLRAVLVSD